MGFQGSRAPLLFANILLAVREIKADFLHGAVPNVPLAVNAGDVRRLPKTENAYTTVSTMHGQQQTQELANRLEVNSLQL
jgi:hypothetical protein